MGTFSKLLRTSVIITLCCVASWFGMSSQLLASYRSNQDSAHDFFSSPFNVDSLVTADFNTIMSPEDHNRADMGEAFDQRRRQQLSFFQENEGYTASGIRSNVPWSGIEKAEWCQAPSEPPLAYEDCQWDTWVFKFGVHGGLTNALHFILKGTSYSISLDTLIAWPANGQGQYHQNGLNKFHDIII